MPITFVIVTIKYGAKSGHHLSND